MISGWGWGGNDLNPSQTGPPPRARGVGGGEEGGGGGQGRGAPPGRKLNINQSIAGSRATQRRRGCGGGRGTGAGRVGGREEGGGGSGEAAVGKPCGRDRARGAAEDRGPSAARAAGAPGRSGRRGAGSAPPPPRGESRVRLPLPAPRRARPGAEAAATRLALVAWSPRGGADWRAGGGHGRLGSGSRSLRQVLSTSEIRGLPPPPPPPPPTTHRLRPSEQLFAVPASSPSARSRPAGPAAQAEKAAAPSELARSRVQNNGPGVPNGRSAGTARRAVGGTGERAVCRAQSREHPWMKSLERSQRRRHLDRCRPSPPEAVPRWQRGRRGRLTPGFGAGTPGTSSGAGPGLRAPAELGGEDLASRFPGGRAGASPAGPAKASLSPKLLPPAAAAAARSPAPAPAAALI